jgi:hypothetical protein
MPNWLIVLLIAYMQCGLLLAWYLFRRRVLALRHDFGVMQEAGAAALRELAAEVADLKRQLRGLAGNRARRPPAAESQILQQAKRRGALEMARRGMAAYHISEALNMRRAEVETLLRLERLQRRASDQPGHAAASWLETLS